MRGTLERVDPVEPLERLDAHSSMIFFLSAPDLREHYFISDSFEELWGQSREELIADPLAFREGIHPDDRTKFQHAVERVRDGESIQCTLRIDPQEDFHRRGQLTGVPIHDQHGELAAIGGLVQEPVDRDEINRQLRQYERAVESSTDLVVAVDTEERYLLVNDAYCEYHGLDPGGVIGRQLSEVLDAEIYDTISPHVTRALQGEQVGYRMRRTHPERGERVFDIQYYPLRHHGTITGGVGALRDVTDREERTRHLQVLDRVLRHNLRNDLTLIRGLGESISNTEDTDRQAGSRIVETADDLLQMSDKGRTITRVITEQPTHSEIEIVECVNQVVESISTDGSLAVTLPEESHVSAVPALEDAIDELVRNAIEHHDGTDPTVSIQGCHRGDHIELEIADDGPGLPAADRAILEEGTPPEALDHGSGLGLWLVYWVIKRSHGNVSVHTRDPRGTRIVLELPVPRH